MEMRLENLFFYWGLGTIRLSIRSEFWNKLLKWPFDWTNSGLWWRIVFGCVLRHLCRTRPKMPQPRKGTCVCFGMWCSGGCAPDRSSAADRVFPIIATAICGAFDKGGRCVYSMPWALNTHSSTARSSLLTKRHLAQKGTQPQAITRAAGWYCMWRQLVVSKAGCVRRGRGDPAKIELHAPAKLWRRRLKVVAPRRQLLRKVERRQGQCHVVRQTRLFLRRTLKTYS